MDPHRHTQIHTHSRWSDDAVSFCTLCVCHRCEYSTVATSNKLVPKTTTATCVYHKRTTSCRTLGHALARSRPLMRWAQTTMCATRGKEDLLALVFVLRAVCVRLRLTNARIHCGKIAMSFFCYGLFSNFKH